MTEFCILPRAAFALRTCAGAAVVMAGLALAAISPVRAADIPSDIHIDFSSVVVSRDELVCLALNDYWEARSETLAGRIAVAQVVLNRAMDPRFPNNLCEVVKQNHFKEVANRCQFSWFCDDRADTPFEADAWRTSLKLAAAVLQADSAIPDPTGGALWYHADTVRPSWTADYETTTIIGSHVFYREGDSPSRATARKPFIYRLNAFAEHIARQNPRRSTAVASAGGGVSTVGVQRGPAPTQPLAR